MEDIEIGNTIETLFEKLTKKSYVLYFHNLKFDGEFIIYYLLNNGYEYIKDKKEKRDKTFTTLITDMGQFYRIEIYHKMGVHPIKTTINDSLKLIPFKVEFIAKTFGLPISKLEIDYYKPRPRGYELNDEEKEYIKNDVKIVAMALKIMANENINKLTIGSSALNDFKSRFGKNKFFQMFPLLKRELYEDLKPSYKGGFTYLNPKYASLENGETTILDVNSLYPSRMRYERLPFGDPIFFVGKYSEDKVYDLYIQRISCKFIIKQNKIPTIQIKNTMSFIDNEYLTSSNGEIVILTLTNIDLLLFLEHYEVDELEYICGWKFKSMCGLFNSYIDYWVERKNQATIDKNKGVRTICKLMLNSLYGKFATSMKSVLKRPLIENGIVKYKNMEETEKPGIYLPMGAFITAYARRVTIETSQKIKEYSIKKYGRDMYIYSDTDSIHTTLSLEELKQFCDIDDVKLGAWKCEGVAIRSKFLRQKTYIEEFEEDGEKHLEITCAGMSERCYKYVTWDNFECGLTTPDKFTFKHVVGGVKLVNTEFTIKSK